MLKKLVLRIIEFANRVDGIHLGAFAAQSAFFILMSFFPLMNIMLALTKYLPFTVDEILGLLDNVIPVDFEIYVVDIIDDIYANNSLQLTIISVIICLWSASKGIMAMRNGLYDVYGTRTTKNYFILRFFSMIHTMIFVIMIILIMILNLFGTYIAAFFVRKFPFIENAATLIIGLRGVFSFVLFLLIILSFYISVILHGGIKLTKLKDNIWGALFSAITWELETMAFSFYMDKIMKDSYMYGSLTTVILIMLWIYGGVYIIFYGGELNVFLHELKEDRKIAEKADDKHENMIEKKAEKKHKSYKIQSDEKTEETVKMDVSKKCAQNGVVFEAKGDKSCN